MALRRKFSQTKLFRALIVSGALVLLLIFQPRFIMEPLRSVIMAISWPIEGALSAVGFELRDTFSFFNSIGELKSDNERLQKENIELLAENSRWQNVSKENDDLRKQLELLPREKYSLSAAEVIGRDAGGIGSWITIDKGSSDGIAQDMPVIVGQGVLVGRIIDVFPQSSRVMLLSHPESRVSGISVAGEAQGIIKGEHGLGILFDMVLQEASLNAGDRVVTSGLGGEFPKDLFIGTLQGERLSDDHLYQRASIVTPVKYETLRYVFIIKNTK